MPPMQISPCRTMLSARYPFQHQRKNYNEYFGGPPCFKYLVQCCVLTLISADVLFPKFVNYGSFLSVY